jgi:hypothetical protein
MKFEFSYREFMISSCRFLHLELKIELYVRPSISSADYIGLYKFCMHILKFNDRAVDINGKVHRPIFRDFFAEFDIIKSRN